jgi:hypothetical protein
VSECRQVDQRICQKRSFVTLVAAQPTGNRLPRSEPRRKIYDVLARLCPAAIAAVHCDPTNERDRARTGPSPRCVPRSAMGPKRQPLFFRSGGHTGLEAASDRDACCGRRAVIRCGPHRGLLCARSCRLAHMSECLEWGRKLPIRFLARHQESCPLLSIGKSNPNKALSLRVHHHLCNANGGSGCEG